jgi:hypothetical protein
MPIIVFRVFPRVRMLAHPSSFSDFMPGVMTGGHTLPEHILKYLILSIYSILTTLSQ